MPTELETQAAEAKCPIRQDSWDDIGGTHPSVCQCAEPGKAYGTGLRWPPLSRESTIASCFGEHCNYEAPGHHSHQIRVPDCTLEKVLNVAHQEGPTVFLNVMAAIGTWYSGHSQQGTPTDAALAALLSQETPATPARKPPTPE